MTIGKRLREERERLGLNQPNFAALANTTKQTLFSWENGKTAPDGFQLMALATAGADVLYILTGRRSQAVAEVELLPPDEQVLIDSYRRCSPDAKRNLIQSAALLSAGMAPAAAPRTGRGHTSGGLSQQATGNNNVQFSTVGTAPRRRSG